MATMTTTTRAPRARVAPGRIWRLGVLVAAVAGGGNALVYTLARALGVSFLMPQMPGAAPTPLPIGMVIAMSVAGAAVGAAAFAALVRVAPRHAGLFPIVGLAVLVLSFGMPLSLDATDGATKATLLLMHVVAGGSTIGLLSGLGRRREW